MTIRQTLGLKTHLIQVNHTVITGIQASLSLSLFLPLLCLLFLLLTDFPIWERSFQVKITRGVTVFFMKTLPPILVSLLIAGMVFLLDVEAMEVRLATAITALLTEVFLQVTLTTINKIVLLNFAFFFL
jgi:hypothetical protein